MNKRRIAIYCNVYDTVVGQNIAYMNFFSEFGEVCIVSSESDLARVIKEYDILALPGGRDVYSLSYGMSPGFNSHLTNSHYEYLDEKLLVPWLATGKPIIAICRGLQVLNVRMGGALHRHVSGHEQDSKYARSSTLHNMYSTNLHKWMPLEGVTLKDHNPIHQYDINSFHHQAISRLADGFEILGYGDSFVGCPSARSQYARTEHIWVQDKKGSTEYTKSNGKYFVQVELIAHKTLPYIGFQYHPEEMMDDLSLSLCREMLRKHYKDNSYATQEKLKDSTKVTKKWAL
jgi:gamma-glutamyl-gamma-aminobutyrate hydrolase PuuD